MSMKTNYKPGDKIRVTKPGMFLGLEGKVETNNTATTFKPLLVDLNPNGSWSFNYADVVAVGNDKLIVDINANFKKRVVKKADGIVSSAAPPTLEKDMETFQQSKAEKLIIVEHDKPKRAYNRKAKPVKQKRKYTKKQK